MTPAAGPASEARVWSFALAAGVAAGLGAWLAGEWAVNYFTPATEMRVVMGNLFRVAVDGGESLARFRNAILAFGILGVVLGLAMGLAGGLARRSPAAGGVAGLVGALTGGLSGAGVFLLLHPIYSRHWNPESENLTLSLLIHGGVWSTVGAAAGLAFGMGMGGRGRLIRGLLGGVVGGALGAAAFELIGAFAFPLDRTTDPVSVTSLSRLLARSSVGIMVALGIAMALKGGDPKPTAR